MKILIIKNMKEVLRTKTKMRKVMENRKTMILAMERKIIPIAPIIISMIKNKIPIVMIRNKIRMAMIKDKVHLGIVRNKLHTDMIKSKVHIIDMI